MEELLRYIFKFVYAINLDMSMGYMFMPLDKPWRNILTLIRPFILFKFLVLPQEIFPAMYIYQGQMYSHFMNMHPNDFKIHLDDILNTKDSTFHEHLAILDEILTRLKKAGMQVNAKRCSFCGIKLDFVGYLLPQTVHKPLSKCIEAKLKMTPPKNVKWVSALIGIINFIKNHIPGGAWILEPITRLKERNEIQVGWRTATSLQEN